MRLIYSEMSGLCEGVKAKNGNCLTRTREMPVEMPILFGKDGYTKCENLCSGLLLEKG